MLRHFFALLSGVVLCIMLILAYRALTTEPMGASLVVVQKVETRTQITQVSSAEVFFGGDMMFDRGVRLSASKHDEDYLFSCIDQTLASTDLVIANLEGPITGSRSVSVGSSIGTPENYVFTFAPSTAMLLARYRISLVNLGNNHSMDLGRGGLVSTQEYLTQAGVGYFGDPVLSSVAYKTIHDVPLALVSYNEFGGSSSTTISQIISTSKAGYLPIVFAHWGIEYAPTATNYMRTLARSFVDAGAVLVVGSHPHVVEDNETYRDVPIYYSLGNFIFDQHWNNAVTHGLLLRVTFSASGVTNVEELPIVIDSTNRPCLAQS